MNILIIEDEPRTARLLKEMIGELDPSYLVVGTCESVKDSVKFLSFHQKQLDLIFMDIQLTDGLSFDIFKQVEVEPPVVFCTAYDQYTLDAFKSNGIGYILKPFCEDDLAAIFRKIGTWKNRPGSAIHAVVETIRQEAASSSFIVRFRDKIYPLNVVGIACVFLEDEVVFAYDMQGRKHPLSKSVSEVQEALPAAQFFRVNRQAIVNKAAVAELVHYSHRKMIVKLKVPTREHVVLGKAKVPQFLDWLET